MIKNNLHIIEPLLKFDSPDEFYFLQIIKRRKENAGMDKDANIIKTYFITSPSYLKEKIGEMETLCIENNARAYIHLNRRSSKKIAIEGIKYFVDMLSHPNPTNMLRTSTEHLTGKINSEPRETRKWIVDIDSFDIDEINKVKSTITDTFNASIYAEVQTKNGVHLISQPFNKREFHRMFTEVDIHTDNPTLLIFNE